MNADGMVQFAAILAPPHFQPGKIIFRGHEYSEGIFHILYCLPVFDPLKPKFLQLFIRQRDREQMFRLEPEFLNGRFHTHFLILVINIFYNSFPGVAIIFCDHQVALLDFVQPDHMDAIFGYLNIQKNAIMIFFGKK